MWGSHATACMSSLWGGQSSPRPWLWPWGQRWGSRRGPSWAPSSGWLWLLARVVTASPGRRVPPLGATSSTRPAQKGRAGAQEAGRQGDGADEPTLPARRHTHTKYTHLHTATQHTARASVPPSAGTAPGHLQKPVGALGTLGLLCHSGHRRWGQTPEKKRNVRERTCPLLPGGPVHMRTWGCKSDSRLLCVSV